MRNWADRTFVLHITLVGLMTIFASDLFSKSIQLETMAYFAPISISVKNYGGIPWVRYSPETEGRIAHLGATKGSVYYQTCGDSNLHQFDLAKRVGRPVTAFSSGKRASHYKALYSQEGAMLVPVEGKKGMPAYFVGFEGESNPPKRITLQSDYGSADRLRLKGFSVQEHRQKATKKILSVSVGGTSQSKDRTFDEEAFDRSQTVGGNHELIFETEIVRFRIVKNSYIDYSVVLKRKDENDFFVAVPSTKDVIHNSINVDGKIFEWTMIHLKDGREIGRGSMGEFYFLPEFSISSDGLIYVVGSNRDQVLVLRKAKGYL